MAAVYVSRRPRSDPAMRYICDGFDAIDAASISHAARIFAKRIARQKYGRNGRCRALRLRTERGGQGASFEALLGTHPSANEARQAYRFTVWILR